MKKISIVIILASFIVTLGYAGNPDRQGEAGAYELLMLPWARTAGLNGLNTSIVSGLEAMRMNPAGISRVDGSEVVMAQTQYFSGTDINIYALGYATKIGKDKTSGFAVTLEALDFGDIDITTTAAPEGTGGSFRPLFMNLALGYSKSFEDKIFIGVTGRFVSQSLSELNAVGFAVDAGIQYVTGEQQNFKFGVVLRNFGTPMTFGGQGLAFEEEVDVNSGTTNITFDQQAKEYQLPTQLNIGLSYDIYSKQVNRFSLMGSFIANTFSADQIGGGVEYSFKETFMLRASYRADLEEPNIEGFNNVYTGFGAGASFVVPVNRDKTNHFGLDYAYRTTNPFNGTHNIGLRFLL